MNDRELKELLENILLQVNDISTQQKEDHLILKALEHSAEVNKAEHDSIQNNIVHIQGDIKSIDENIDAVKEVLGRHEVDITVLKRRPV